MRRTTLSSNRNKQNLSAKNAWLRKTQSALKMISLRWRIESLLITKTSEQHSWIRINSQWVDMDPYRVPRVSMDNPRRLKKAKSPSYFQKLSDNKTFHKTKIRLSIEKRSLRKTGKKMWPWLKLFKQYWKWIVRETSYKQEKFRRISETKTENVCLE